MGTGDTRRKIMANQDAAFGLRPLKTFGSQDDSTGMSSHKISPGDASVIYQGSLVGSPATGTGYVDLQTAALVAEISTYPVVVAFTREP